jgi:hypothetical protein
MSRITQQRLKRNIISKKRIIGGRVVFHRKIRDGSSIVLLGHGYIPFSQKRYMGKLVKFYGGNAFTRFFRKTLPSAFKKVKEVVSSPEFRKGFKQGFNMVWKPGSSLLNLVAPESKAITEPINQVASKIGLGARKGRKGRKAKIHSKKSVKKYSKKIGKGKKEKKHVTFRVKRGKHSKKKVLKHIGDFLGSGVSVV